MGLMDIVNIVVVVGVVVVVKARVKGISSIFPDTVEDARYITDSTPMPDLHKNHACDTPNTYVTTYSKNTSVINGSGRRGATILMQLKQDYADAANYTRWALDDASVTAITGEIIDNIEYTGDARDYTLMTPIINHREASPSACRGHVQGWQYALKNKNKNTNKNNNNNPATKKTEKGATP